MRVVRQRLSWLVGGWLACQVAALAAAPVTLCVSTPAPASHKTVCCPGLKPGQMCPMHHTREGVQICVMLSPCSASDAALLPLVAGAGLLPSAPPVASVVFSAQSIPPVTALAIERAERPDSPPPRR